MLRESSLQLGDRLTLGGAPQAVDLNYRKSETATTAERPGWFLLASRLEFKIETIQKRQEEIQTALDQLSRSLNRTVEVMLLFDQRLTETQTEMREHFIHTQHLGVRGVRRVPALWSKLKATVAQWWRRLTHRS